MYTSLDTQSKYIHTEHKFMITENISREKMIFSHLISTLIPPFINQTLTYIYLATQFFFFKRHCILHVYTRSIKQSKYIKKGKNSWEIQKKKKKRQNYLAGLSIK